MKTQKMIYVDGHNWERFKKAVGNASEAINKYVENYISGTKGKEVIDLEILNIELQEKQKVLMATQAELDKMQKQKDQYYEAQAQATKEKLEHEKVELEKSHTCIQCGNLLPEQMKTHGFPKGVVCHACFLSARGEDILKWK